MSWLRDRRWLAAALLLMVGCGGGGGKDAPADDVRLGRESEGTRPETLVAALGDSITAGSPLWDPDPGVRRLIGNALDRRSQYEYWAELRLPNVRFRNCGVAGQRTDQIAARLDDCAAGADVLIVQGGANDIAQMRPVEVAARNLRALVARARGRGLRVALAEVLPWNNGYPLAASRIRRLNRLIGRIGADEEVPVLPWYERLEDPRAPGRMKREWTIDGDHPSVKGHERLAGVVELP